MSDPSDEDIPSDEWIAGALIRASRRLFPHEGAVSPVDVLRILDSDETDLMRELVREVVAFERSRQAEVASEPEERRAEEPETITHERAQELLHSWCSVCECVNVSAPAGLQLYIFQQRRASEASDNGASAKRVGEPEIRTAISRAIDSEARRLSMAYTLSYDLIKAASSAVLLLIDRASSPPLRADTVAAWINADAARAKWVAELSSVRAAAKEPAKTTAGPAGSQKDRDVDASPPAATGRPIEQPAEEKQEPGRDGGERDA